MRQEIEQLMLEGETKRVLYLSADNCFDMQESVRAYLEGHKSKKGLEWLKATIAKNPNLYISLDKDLYKDEDFKLFILYHTSREYDLFMHLPQEWKDDPKVLINVLMRGYNKDYAAKNNVEAPFKEGDLMYGAAVLGNFTNVAGFIKENNDNKDGAIKVVRDYYVQLPAMWRESEYIIKLLFKTKEEVDNTVYDFEDGPGKVSGYEYLSQYIKSIPNAELVKDLKEYLDDNKEAEFDSLYYGLDKTVAMHYMTKELNDKNNDNGKVERKGKSLKI